MSSRLLSFSLGLNLILLGVAGYWAANHSGKSHPPASRQIREVKRPAENARRLAPTTTVVAAPLRWSELESEDYRAYVANLRNAGCPEPVLRQIISAELNELYAKKAFALAQEFHRDFWEIAARENVRQYFEKTIGQKVRALCDESGAVLKQLVGDGGSERFRAPMPDVSEIQMADFLSSEKQEQLRQLAENYEAQKQLIQQGNFSPEETASQLANLQSEMESAQARILSPSELAEYRLRQSDAAKEVQQLCGDFNETEMRNMARAIDEYHRLAENQSENNMQSETLDEKLQAVLGAERFADFNRARSESYREIYEITSEFGLPGATAAEIFDLRLDSEKRSDEIRSNKNWRAEEKQALLDDLQDQVERSMLSKFGAGAFRSYKARDGRWINSLGRL